jgi:hypothetical protein
MKPFTQEQQQEAIRIIKGFANHVNNSLNEHLDLTDSAKKFANSIKPKYHIITNLCGDISFLKENGFTKNVKEAITFNTLDEANTYKTAIEYDYSNFFIVTG